MYLSPEYSYSSSYKYDKYDEEYEYSANRVWSLDTAYIDLDIDQNYKHTNKIIPSGNVCYYRINPFDVEKMDYAPPQGIGIDIFTHTYMYRNDVRTGYFLNRSLIYMNIALEYQVSKMEKELEELSEFFDDKKIVINLIAKLNDKYIMNDDIIRIIINKYLY